MTDHRPSHAVLDELWPQHRALRQQIPEAYQDFDNLSSSVMSDGALSVKDKELIALAIGIVQGCDGCIAANAKGAVRAGATAAEAAEAISVAIMMHGGPATVHGARGYAAFCEFEAALR
ncbi:carboxymuconolactone decarboxylase family protein [soil metagenome]